MEIKSLTRKLTQDNFTTEKVDVLQNNLLGFYDDNGEYCITPQIMEELKNLPKIKKRSFHNSLFCVGNLLGFGEIAFELEYNKKISEEEFAKATLYVLEEVEKINGYLQNTIKTKVAEFENTVEDFIEASYEFFHIIVDNSTDVSDDEGMERNILDDIEKQDSFILAKKQYTLQLEKLCNEKCLDAYGKYFTYRYSALTKMNNDFSQAVIELFEEEYARIEKLFLKDKNYKILNELLDKCIEEISGTSENYIAQEKEYDELIAQAMENFSESIKVLHQKLGNKALNMLDKEDRQKMENLIEAEEYHNQHNDNPQVENIEPVIAEEFQENIENEIEEPSEEQVLEPEENNINEDKIVSDLFSANQSENASNTYQEMIDHIQDNNEIIKEEKANIEDSVIASGKILDVNRTYDFDESLKETPEVEEKDAVSSLQARVGRLSALTSKTDVVKEESTIDSTTANPVPENQSTDDFVRSEVSSYLNDQVKTEVPQEKQQEMKAKPRSFEQLFNYLNEQNKIKNDEMALRNQRIKELNNQNQEMKNPFNDLTRGL